MLAVVHAGRFLEADVPDADVPAMRTAATMRLEADAVRLALQEGRLRMLDEEATLDPVSSVRRDDHESDEHYRNTVITLLREGYTLVALGKDWARMREPKR